MYELVAVVRAELGHGGRKMGQTDTFPHDSIQLLVLARGDLSEPISSSHAVATLKEAFEEVRRRCVDHDAGEVLAADQEDVVDTQINRSHLVARCAMRAFPLDDHGASASQAVGSREERLTVLPCSAEVLGQTGAVVRSLKPVPGFG